MQRRNDFDEQPTDVSPPLATRYEPETRSYHFAGDERAEQTDRPERPA